MDKINNNGNAKVKEYANNLRKTVTYAGAKILQSHMPNITSAINTNRGAARDVIDFVRKSKPNINKTAKAVSTLPEIKYAKDFMKNLKSDLKTGKFYNQERANSDEAMAAMMSSLGMNMDMSFTETDFGDYGDIDAPDSGHDASSDIGKIMAMSEACQSSRTEALINSLGNIQTANTEYLGDLQTSFFNTNMSYMSKMHEEQIGILGNLQNIGMSILDFNNSVVTDHINKTNSYYDESINELRQIKEYLHETTEMKRNAYNGQGKYKSSKVTIDDVLDFGGTPNISNYVKGIKQNISDVTSAGFGMSMDRNMLGGVMSMASNSPWSFLASMVGYGILPNSLKKGMGDLDKSVSGLFSSLIVKMNNMSKMGRSNPFSILGKILGIDTAPAKLDLTYHKRMGVNGDIEVKKAKAITDVIPAYLAKLVALQTGKEMVYDYGTGKFSDRRVVRKKLDEEMKGFGSSELRPTETALRNRLRSKDFADKETMEKEVAAFMKFLKSGEFFNPLKSKYEDLQLRGLNLQHGEESFKSLQKAIASLSKKQQNAIPHQQLSAQSTQKKRQNDFNTGLNESGGAVVYNGWDMEYANSVPLPSEGSVEHWNYKSAEQKKLEKIKNRQKRVDVSSMRNANRNKTTNKLNNDDNRNAFNAMKNRQATEDYNGNDLSSRISKTAFGQKFNDMKSKLDNMLKSPVAFMQGIVGTVDKTIYKIMYGNDNPEEAGRGIIGTIKDKFSEYTGRALDFVDKSVVKPLHETLFGETGIFSKMTGTNFGKDMKGFLPKAVIGAFAGLAGSSILPGGPLLGTFIGAGIAFASHSEKVKEQLFGKLSEDGKSRDSSGFVSPEIQKMIKASLPAMGAGAIIGGAAGLVLPGGVLLNAFLGSGIAFASKSEGFKNFLFGKAGTDGKRDSSGIIPPEYQAFVKKHFPAGLKGAGVGLITSLFMPGGPLLRAIMGMASGMITQSDKFKTWMWGKEDPDTLKRKGGIAGSIRDFMKDELFTPFKKYMSKTKDGIKTWFSDAITKPLAVAKEPMKKAFDIMAEQLKTAWKGTMDGLKDTINGIFERNIGAPLKDFIKQKITDPLKEHLTKFFSFLGRAIGNILTAPIKAITGIAKAIIEEDQKKKDKAKEKEKKEAERAEKKSAFSRFKDSLSSMLKKKANPNETGFVMKDSEAPIDDKATRESIIAEFKQSREANEHKQTTSNIIQFPQPTQTNTTTQSTSHNHQAQADVSSFPTSTVTNKSNGVEMRTVNGGTETVGGPPPGAKTRSGAYKGTAKTNSKAQDETAATEDRNDPNFKLNKDLGKNVKIIADEVKGQLNGVGYNLEYIKNILAQEFGEPSILPAGLRGLGGNHKRKGLLGKIFGGMYKLVTSPFKFFGDMASGFFDKLNFGKKIGKGIAGLVNVVTLPYKMIKTTLGIVTQMGKLTLDAFGILGSGIRGFVDFMGGLGRGMGEGVGKGLGHIGHGIGLGISALGTAVSGISSAFKTLACEILPKLVSGFLDVGSALFGLVRGAARIATAPIRAMFSKTKTVTAKNKMEVTVIGGKLDSVKTIEHVKHVEHVSNIGPVGPGRGRGIGPRRNPDGTIRWFADGGIVTQPKVIGVGEAGPEAVIPLHKLPSLFGKMTDKAPNIFAGIGAKVTMFRDKIVPYTFKGGLLKAFTGGIEETKKIVRLRKLQMGMASIRTPQAYLSKVLELLYSNVEATLSMRPAPTKTDEKQDLKDLIPTVLTVAGALLATLMPKSKIPNAVLLATTKAAKNAGVVDGLLTKGMKVKLDANGKPMVGLDGKPVLEKMSTEEVMAQSARKASGSDFVVGEEKAIMSRVKPRADVNPLKTVTNATTSEIKSASTSNVISLADYSAKKAALEAAKKDAAKSASNTAIRDGIALGATRLGKGALTLGKDIITGTVRGAVNILRPTNILKAGGITLGEKITAKSIVKFAPKLLSSTAIGLAKATPLAQWSNIIGQFLKKAVKTAMGGPAEELAMQAIGKTVAEGAAKAGAAAATGPGIIVVLVAMAIADVTSGMCEAANIFEVEHGDVTWGMRFAAGLAKGLSGLVFGIIPVGWLAGKIYNAVGSKKDKEALTTKKKTFKADYDKYVKDGGKGSFTDYNDKTNKTVWGHIKDGAGAIGNAFKDSYNNQKKLVTAIADGTAWKSTKKLAGEVVDGTAWKNVKTKTGQIWESAKDGIGKKFNGVKEEIGKEWNNTKQAASSVWGSVKDSKLVSGVVDILASYNHAKEKIGDSVGKFASSGVKFAKKKLLAIPAVKKAKEWTDNNLEYAGNSVKSGIKKAKAWTNNNLEYLGNGINGGINKAKAWTNNNLEYLGNGINGGVNKAKSWTTNNLKYVGNTINSGIDKAKSWTADVWKGFSDALDKNKTIQDIKYFISNNLEYIGKGIDAVKGFVSNNLEYIGKGIDKVNYFVSNNLDYIGKGIDAVKGFLSNNLEYIGNEIHDVGYKISQTYEWFTKEAGKVIGKVFGDVVDAIMHPGKAISDMGDKVSYKIDETRKWMFGEGAGRGNSDGYTYYNQKDPKWKNQSFGKYDGKTDTVGEGGCAPTSAAIINSTLSGQSVTPSTMSKKALNLGYKLDNNGTTPDFFNATGSQYGVSYNQANDSKTIMNSLSAGKPTVLMGQDTKGGNTPYGSGMHYVVATGADRAGNINILDPENKSNNKKFRGSDVLKNTTTALVASKQNGRGRKVGRSVVSDTLAELASFGSSLDVLTGGLDKSSDSLGTSLSDLTNGGDTASQTYGPPSPASPSNGNGLVRGEMSQSQFIKAILPGAMATYKKYHVLPSLTLAQAALESGWGKSGLAQQAYNLFGIKEFGNGPSITMPTREEVNGRSVTVMAKFRKYNSFAESIEDHGKFLAENSRYKATLGASNYIEAAARIGQSGYATDSGYGAAILNMMKYNGFDKADIGEIPPLAAGAGSRVGRGVWNDIKTFSKQGMTDMVDTDAIVNKSYDTILPAAVNKSYNTIVPSVVNMMNEQLIPGVTNMINGALGQDTGEPTATPNVTGRGSINTAVRSTMNKLTSPLDIVGRALNVINKRKATASLAGTSDLINSARGTTDPVIEKILNSMASSFNVMCEYLGTIAKNTGEMIANKQNVNNTVVNAGTNITNHSNSLLNGGDNSNSSGNHSKYSLLDGISNGPDF